MADAVLLELLDTLGSAKLTDFTITCDDAEFKVHRFAVRCSPKLAKYEFDEIHFPGVDRDTLSRVILRMYGLRDLFFEVGPIDNGGSGVFPQRERQIPGTPRPPLDDERVERMKVKAKVYMLAAKLRIETLKFLSAVGFISRFVTALSDERIAEPLRTMYEHTRPGDVEVRLPVTRMCINNHRLLPRAALEVLMQHEPWVVAIPQMNAFFRENLLDVGPTPEDTTMGFVRGVNAFVDGRKLREVLETYGELRYFDVSRPREAAYVEFMTSKGFAAAVAANPIPVGSNKVFLEVRRPRPNAYGGSNYKANKAANKAKRDGRQAMSIL